MGTKSGRIEFETESFSVFAMVYTVDFHWEVNGKTYEFSIPGGGFVSLAHLVEILGIAESETENENKEEAAEDVEEGQTGTSDAAEKFLAEVESVEFSNPELVWVGKVDEAVTVGGLKEANELKVEYSTDLTKEQIAEINAQTVEAGDWALISMQPFTTEETLTVTMKDGMQWTVKVTDAQKPYTDVSQLEDGKYIIYRSDSSGTIQLFLKNDGTSQIINPQENPVTSEQFSNFTWEVKNNGDSFTIKSTSDSSRYINLLGNNNVYDEWSSTINWWQQAPAISLSNSSKGILMSQNNKVLARNTTRGFYNSTNSSKATELIFYKIEDNPSGGSSSTPGIILTDEEREEYEKWKKTIEQWNTLSNYGKTAEVYNEDNRIYKIEIKADSGITDFYQDVDLGFVLDVSMSMKFPASLRALEEDGEELKTWLSVRDLNAAYNTHTDEYDKENCFYVISDPAVTSTVYKVYKDGNNWKYHDASLTATEASGSGKLYTVSDTTVLPKDAFRMKYTLYYADDVNDWSRFDYLKKSVDYTIDTLKQVVRVTPGDQMDNTAAVRVAYNLFCKDIVKSDTFEDLRVQTVHDHWNIPLVVANMGSGTQQNKALYDPTGTTYDNQSANEFGWDNTNQQYLILVTDGAPNGPSIQDVIDAARNLKRQYPNIKIFTIGLSTKDVDGGSAMLYEIADTIDGQKQFYEAEKAQDLEYILLKILRTIMTKGLVRGKITDTIDKGFYPVDVQGNPISTGVYSADGTRISGVQISDYVSNGKPTTAHQNEAFYTWEQVGDEWKITWYNQEIGWDDNDTTTGNPWTGTVYVKAKEDYLGGNLIETNDGHAQIEPTGLKMVIDGTPEANWRPLEGMTPIDLPVPRVNVHNLETKENSTTWTVYKGTTVTPGVQIRALWNSIPIEEVVSSTKDNAHKITTGSAANVGTAGTGETFSLGDLMSEVAPSFNVDTLINQITESKNSASQEFNYTAYGHESGKITVNVERIKGNQTPAVHTAETVGTEVEQYKVIFTYKPYTETERMDGKVKEPSDTEHHNGEAGRGAEETGTMTSTNTHTINVFQKGIKVTKVDKSNPSTVLPGATFELFRVDSAGTADVSAYNLPVGKYSKVGDDLTTDNNGIITINPVIPDKDSAVTDKTLYEPNISVGDSQNVSHDTVFYLVEKTPPRKDNAVYDKMPGAIKFTMTLNENKGNDNTATLYDWMQTANITAAEHGNGSTVYLTDDVTNNSDVYAYMLKNARSTDITLIKVDMVTKNSIGGAKFSLLKGSENVDLTKLSITAISSGAVVMPEGYNYNDTAIKVVTVPEGGIRIAGLADGTYTLREVAAPAGYLITDSDKVFKTENGAIMETNDTVHANEATDIAFKVENTPGPALPATGGQGTALLMLFGIMLTGIGGAGLMMRRRRKEAA